MKLNDLFDTNCKDVYVIAEVSQNHDGSLGQAHAFIDAVSTTGADAIKFQTHIADAESSIDEPFRVNFSYEDNTRYDYWKRMEFTKEQWIGLMKHANEKGLDFLSSPFSKEAVDLLENIGIPGWKVGSGEVFNKYLLKEMASTKKPILLSSGLSTYSDIKNQVQTINDCGNDKIGIMQCTTAYPSSYDEVGLNVIQKLIEDYGYPIGLSDHSGTMYPSLAAVALGAKIVETHISMSKWMFGPDVSSSLTVEDFSNMVRGIRATTTMRCSEVDKNSISSSKKQLKSIFSKGIYAAFDICAGEKITIHNISMKKPFRGIPADNYEQIIGKNALSFISKGTAITEDMIG